MHNWTQGDIDTGEINIHYYRTGHGDLPPLVLCHGFSDNGLCWTRLAEVLKSQFDIIMIDARNHGLSGHGTASLQAMTDDLAAVISALHLDQPAALGHSMGASMVADLAARYPARVSRILLEDPPWTKHQGAVRDKDVAQRREGFRQYLASLNNKTEAQIMAFGKQQNPTWHADELPAWAASKKQVSEWAMEGLTLGNWSESVAQIQCPAWLIYADGAGDGIVKHDTAHQVAAVNSHFILRHIEGAGHNIRREQFDRYRLAVVEGLI